MEWVKSSNVITVTKSVTSVEAVITRYLLTSKSEGVTIDGEVWSDIRQYPTSEYRYVWAYDTYHYTDRTTGHTSPYILDTYQAPRFEVNFSTDSYEIHPRWNSDSFFEFSITLLNGLVGEPRFIMESSYIGIGLPILDTDTGLYHINIKNDLYTSTSFSLKIIIMDCVETFTIYGKLVDAESKYLGTIEGTDISYLPDKDISIDMDYCFLIDRNNNTSGSLYVFSSLFGQWYQINSPELSLSNETKSYMYSNAMKDILENVKKESSIYSEFAYFDTIITRLITADYISSKDIKSQNYIKGSKGYRLKSETGKLEAIDAEISGDISSDAMCSSYAETLASSGLSLASAVKTVNYFGSPRSVNAFSIEDFSALTVCGTYIFDGGTVNNSSSSYTANSNTPFYVIKEPYTSQYLKAEEAFSIKIFASRADVAGIYLGILYLYPDDDGLYLHDQGDHNSITLSLSSPRKAVLTHNILPLSPPSNSFGIGDTNYPYSSVDIGSLGCAFRSLYARFIYGYGAEFGGDVNVKNKITALSASIPSLYSSSIYVGGLTSLWGTDGYISLNNNLIPNDGIKVYGAVFN